MGKRPPSFEFYPSDFRDGVRKLTLEEIGAYALLLCEQFEVETLPSTDDELMRIMRCDEKTFRRIWVKLSNKFELTDKGFQNVRLAEERTVSFSSWNVKKPPPVNKKPEDKKEPPLPTADIAIVITHYKTYHPQSKPGEAERDKIKARLREKYSSADLMKAIDGCHVDPFHCGENEEGKKWQALSLIVRDSTHVASFMEAWDERDSLVQSKKIRSGARAKQNYQKLMGGGDTPP